MINIKDFENYSSISQMELSPCRGYISYVVIKPNISINGYDKSLYVYNLHTEKHTLMINKLVFTEYFWVETSLVYKDKSDKGSTVYKRIDINTLSVSEFLKLDADVKNIYMINEEIFAFTQIFDANKIEYPDELKFLYDEQHNFREVDELPFWSDGVGVTNRLRTRLYIYNKKSHQVRAITGELEQVESVKVHCGSIFYKSEIYKEYRTSSGIKKYDITAGQTSVLIDDGKYMIRDFDFAGDNMFFAGSDKLTQIATDNPKIYKMSQGNIEMFYDDDISIADTISTDCKLGKNDTFKVYDDGIYFIVTDRKSSHISKLTFDGERCVLTDRDISVNGFIKNHDSIYYSAFKNVHLQEMYKINSEGTDTQLSHYNDESINDEDISIPEYMTFHNNGFDVDYVVLKPADFEENKKYPAILYIHGGAKVCYSDVFFHEMQYLAANGYFVVYGNPRGSDGQGGKFARLLGDYGNYDYQDMMKAMDTAIDTYPQIDTDRLGVCGGSYGGIMTNWTVGHTNRFACAVAQRSICNMFTAYAVADNGYNFVKEQMDSDPWTNPDKLWKQSPLKYADKVTTPLLLIHSIEDYRCHYTEAVQMFTALKTRGIDTKICLFEGESHGLSRNGKPVQRVKRLYEIKKWLDKYLMIKGI